MAQPHKGPRAQVKSRVDTDVYAALRRMATERGTSVSQIAADLLAIAVGHPDAVRELNTDTTTEEALPLAI